MRKTFRALLALLGIPGDLDSFLKFLGVSGGVGAVGAYLQFLSGGSWAWVFMFALAGAALTMLGLYYFLMARKLLTVFSRISIETINVAQARLEDADGKPTIHGMTFDCTLHNHSDQIIYFKIHRAALSVSGLIRPDATIKDSVEAIQSHSGQKFIMPTLPPIPLEEGKGPRGRIELEILYGTSKDNLPYLFSYVGEPHISVYLDKEKDQAVMNLTTPIRELSHKKQSWF